MNHAKTAKPGTLMSNFIRVWLPNKYSVAEACVFKEQRGGSVRLQVFCLIVGK